MSPSEENRFDPSEIPRLIPELSSRKPDTLALTFAYLDTGASMIRHALEQSLIPDPELGDVLESDGIHPMLDWLSRPLIVDRVNQRIAAREVVSRQRASDGSFRHRWRYHHRFIEHLIRWVQHQNQRKAFSARVAAEIVQAASSSEPMSTKVRRIGRANLESLFASPHFRDQLFLISVGASDRSRSMLPDFYAHVRERWLPVIHDLIAEHNLTLRPGVDEEDVLDLLTAIGEGIALRELTDPTTGAARAKRASLQATAALVLILACTSTDGLSIEKAVDELIGWRRSQ